MEEPRDRERQTRLLVPDPLTLLEADLKDGKQAELFSSRESFRTSHEKRSHQPHQMNLLLLDPKGRVLEVDLDVKGSHQLWTDQGLPNGYKDSFLMIGTISLFRIS